MENLVGNQYQPQYNQQNCAQPVQQNMPQQTVQQPQVTMQPIAGTQPVTQPIAQPQMGQQAQNVSVPNYSGVNIQIFNPSVTPPGAAAPVYNVNSPNYGTNPTQGCYPSGYYTNNWGQNGVGNGANANASSSTENTSKKTEKREIVQLTDDYIRNLENYLNSQDKEIRMMGAKEVIARLDEDHSRCDDKALNALINKMLQDPHTPIRILAMSALDSRIASGDDFTVNLLQQIQNSKSGYGQDALQASEILLKMSGQKTEKEFEVKNTTKTETKKEETKNETQQIPEIPQVPQEIQEGNV